ncbi:tetratricopeptide repeat protein [Hydrogenimonas sp.]
MSRYLSKIALIVFLLSVLTGCIHKNVEPSGKGIGTFRTFDHEYDYIILALYYKEHGEYSQAYALFDELYEKTGNPEYKIESIKLLIAAKMYEKASKELTALIRKNPENTELYRLMAIAQLRLNRVEEALSYAQKSVEIQPDDIRNVDLLASVYLAKGMNEKACKVYETYYARHHDNMTVVKIASIYYHRLKAPQEAIRLLETHSKMVGCSENVCLFLAELYRQNNDLEHLADIYARLYETTSTTEYAQKAAEIYAYKKEFEKAERILLKSKADERLLLAIYKHTGAYRKASELAKRLYAETLDPVWLAEYGVLIYEAASDRNDPKLLKEVIRSLTKAFREGVDDPLYFNYLGYLLIDHNIDVKWGIELVRKALESEPDSAFYIDSLAWGHYKLGECEKAYREMKKVIEKLGLKDEEIKAHWKKIEKCRSRKK